MLDYLRVMEDRHKKTTLSKVHVLPPEDWTRQHWLVVRDDGGLFCSCLFGLVPEGGDAKERAELIARAVNEYIDRLPAARLPSCVGGLMIERGILSCTRSPRHERAEFVRDANERRKRFPGAPADAKMIHCPDCNSSVWWTGE